MGLEPTPGPWQGPVLPLYYDRPKHQNFSTTALRRQVSVTIKEAGQARKHKCRAGVRSVWESGPGCPRGSPDLQHPGCLNDRRLPLPLGEFGGLSSVGVHASEPFAVLVKDSYLPVLVLAALVFSKLCAFSWSF